MRKFLTGLSSLYLRYSAKVGLACVLAYAISYAIGSHYAVWAVVSTVIAMQLNLAESLQAGINRILSTAVGAACGILLLVLLPREPFCIGAGILGITALFAYLSRYGARWASASIAATIVMLSGMALVGKGHGEAIAFGLMRVAEIVIGVGSAFAVGLVVWPVRLLDTLRADISLQYLECARLTDALATSFLTDQHSLCTDILENVEAKVWSNHDRLQKTRKHESFFFHVEHEVMEVQVVTLDRVVEYLRTMMEALNDYDDAPGDMPLSEEMRALADAVMAALRHIGGESPTGPAPDLVRSLTHGMGLAEANLATLRQSGGVLSHPLHKVLQFFTFYQTMRQLVEALLLTLDRLEGLHRVQDDHAPQRRTV